MSFIHINYKYPDLQSGEHYLVVDIHIITYSYFRRQIMRKEYVFVNDMYVQSLTITFSQTFVTNEATFMRTGVLNIHIIIINEDMKI